MHVTPSGQRTLFGHPRGLTFLFLTEMWERFSFYGMKALLMLYMVKYLFIQPDVGAEVLGFNTVKGTLESFFGPLTNSNPDGSVSFQPLGSQVMGLYVAFVYFTPFFGGMLADRVIGQRRSVILGALLMAIGHFLMASESLFFLALFCLVLGNGCFKPNISTQIGGLYTDDDPRRDRAFGIFYMGINLGAIFSPLVCGTLGEVFGWHYGFAAAGVGMLVGLVFYLIGQRDLGPDQFQSQQTRTPLTADQRKVVGALVMLCLLNIIYWAVYEQQANTMQLWADEKINWTYLGITIPSTWYQSFNPVMVVALVPLLARFWSWQSSRDREPSSVSKMAIGALLLALAFGFIIFGVKVIGTGTGNVLWLVIGTLILSIGEVYLSPIGLSLVSKAAPRQIMSMMMGMWFLSSFAGGFLSGYIGSYYERMTQENFFLMLAALALVTSLAMWAFNKPIRRALGNHGE